MNQHIETSLALRFLPQEKFSQTPVDDKNIST